MTENVVLKLTYRGETHRATVVLHSEDLKDDVLTYEVLKSKVRDAFPHLPSRWTLVYRDEEGDVITLSHALELDEACHVLLGLSSPRIGVAPRSLHFCVVARVSLREKVVAPMLQKLLELAHLARQAAEHVRHSEVLSKGRESIVRIAGGAVSQAGVAISHIRNSEVLERGRDSFGNTASHTRTLLLSARSGVSVGLRRAGSAVASGIERRRSASGVTELDPTEFVKAPVSAVSPSSPSSEVAVTVDLRQSVTRETPVPVVMQTQTSESDDELPALVQVDDNECIEQVQAREVVYESDTDTLCDDDDDREWDVVDNSGVFTATVEEAIDETDGEWTHQLDMLRGILVHIDEEMCCDLLTQYNGDVEAVLVELTNM